jgi:septal ring factor EnvC (AmiA/AmiB activator)
MIRSTLLSLVILLAAPHCALSQCTDSSTVSANNYYLLKGAEARENLALCRDQLKIDAEVIAQQDKIQAKLLDELQKRDKQYNRLRRTTYTIATIFLLTLIL